MPTKKDIKALVSPTPLYAAIGDIRNGADILETMNIDAYLPGWEPAPTKVVAERYRAIRAAARAVAADGLTGDAGTWSTRRELGMLARYIADILEE